ncbi:unnamed protein product [Adineta ricciae]|uniref:Uncharacterized protein n=1 Tax=Adineta ricciae TaxID=249248 RepID=A0A813X472_ADIRI|nr:unnamed protein product [Adineta ricciae]
MMNNAKEAIDKLFNILPDLYRQSQARKKFRRFINEELVWRSQYELLNGLYCLDRIPYVINEFNDKLYVLLEDGRYRFDRINPNLFTYDQTNLILRKVTDDEILDDPTLDQKFEFQFLRSDVKDRIEVISELVIGQISDPNVYLKNDGLNSFRDRKGQQTSSIPHPKNIDRSDSPQNESNEHQTQSDAYGFKHIRAYIDRFLAHYRRAIVLAHRSTNWTLLQNVAKSFYNSLEQLIQYLSTTTLNKIFSVNALLSHSYQTMFIASELLLDMLYRTKPFYDNQNDKLRNTNSNRLNQWFTNLECSWTGTTFNFEQPQDRTILMDLRFIKKFILRALHSLYVAAKWEKLGTIAMRFNALSDHYFADLVSPLLIAAQTALLQQLRDRQNSTDQPHFKAAVAALGRPIHPDDFYTLRPEKLFQISNDMYESSVLPLSLDDRLDPKGFDFYAQTNHALELISIPLDVEFSRKLLRQGLEKTHYSSRSIIECRKMFAFYIFKQEQELAKDFLIFTPVTENISQQEKQISGKKEATSTYQYRPLTPGESLEFSPLESNKIETPPSTRITKESVIETYQTLAKLLLGQNRRDLYCQIQSELGDLYFHCDKLLESKTVWCDVIDLLLESTDVVTTWFKKDSLRNLVSNRVQLIQKCGIWGCLLLAIVTSKLAKYHIHLNCDQHLQTCLLSAYFLRSIFFYTLPHSEHDLDYATLFIDHSAHVWPGVQLTSDEFRLNPSALMDALAYTSEALIRHDICLQVLPVIALYDVFALHCRNVQHTVQARLLRLRALIQLNLFHEAHQIIHILIDGHKLPHTQLPGHYRLSISEANPSKHYKPKYFDNTKSVISDHNIAVLEGLLTSKLSPTLSQLYKSHLTIEFHYLLSLFFIRLAARIPVIADLDLFQNSELKEMLNGPISRTYRRTAANIGDGTKVKSTIFPDESSRSFVHVKSYLIGTGKLFAEKCLNVLQQTDELSRDHPSNLESFEHQLLIDCLTILAECAHQCHLDQLAARYALESLKVLSTVGEDNIAEKKIANGLSKRKSFLPRASAITRHPQKTLNALNILFNSRYSHNLNVYIWLKQRAYLCYIILQQINSLGKVKGIDEHTREELANVQVYIDDGFNESEQYQCESMQATFLLYKALNNLSELVNIKENIQRLNTACQLFQSALTQQNNLLSVEILMNRSLAQILLWEHHCVQDFNGTVTKLIDEKENDKLQSSILDFLVQMRERIQMTSSSHPRDWFSIPVIPLANLYSPLLLPLVFAKLRTATIIVDHAYRSLSEDLTMNNLFENAQTLFRQCLTLNQTLVERYVNIDCECLLHLARIGRLQKRISLTSTMTIPLKTVVKYLLDAIRLCYFSTNDGEFIQTCYFELAIVLLEYTRTSVDGARKLSVKSLPLAKSQDLLVSSKQPQMKLRASVAVSNNINTTEQQQQQQQIKQAASIAIHAATQMAVNQKQRVQLPGLAEEFSETDEIHWPTYLAADIIGYFIFPERRRIFKSAAEKEVLTLAPHFEAKLLPESFDAKLDRLNLAATQDLTWLHLLNYQNNVAKRLDNRQLLSLDCDAVGRSNLFFLHIFPRFVGVTQALQSLYQYSSQCMSIYPSDIYNDSVLQMTSSSTNNLPHRASVSSARTMRSVQTNANGINDEDLEHCPNIHLQMIKKELSDEQLKTEFSLSWYSSNTIRVYTSQAHNQPQLPVFGFYTTGNDGLINVVSVSLEQLLYLHKKYLPLAQIAETDPKQINYNQIQSILRELFILLTGEQTVKIIDDDEALSKITPRLTDSNAYVELERFLNPKFGAQTNDVQLRDWFINTFKQSANTLLLKQD